MHPVQILVHPITPIQINLSKFSNMHIQFVAIGLVSSLLAATSANPLIIRSPLFYRPIATWTVTSFEDGTCSGKQIETKNGIGSSGCKVITETQSPTNSVVGSILVEQLHGDFNFSFYSNTECSTDGQAYIHLHDLPLGKTCEPVYSAKPEAFRVDFIKIATENGLAGPAT